MAPFQKDDVVRLHALLYQVRSYVLEHGADAKGFVPYEKFGVRPSHIHRDAKTHAFAVRLLGEGINKHVAPGRVLRFFHAPSDIAAEKRAAADVLAAAERERVDGAKTSAPAQEVA